MILGQKTHTARRFGDYTNTDGVVTPGSATQFSVKGAIQPLSAKQREDLPGGFAMRAEYLLITKAELNPGDRGDEEPADQLQYGGRWLEVQSIEDWGEAPVLKHNEYVLLRPQTEDAPG